MPTTRLQSARIDPSRLAAGKLASIRTKFVVFFSLILILTSSALSWYFIEVRRVSMTESINQLGTILLTSVVSNGQFRYTGLIAEDRAIVQSSVQIQPVPLRFLATPISSLPWRQPPLGRDMTPSCCIIPIMSM